MKVLNMGSLNIDYVYTVDHIILPGETEATTSRNIFLGGKGMNQSCALAKAGAEVYHGGMIGQDGTMFLDACKEYGVQDAFIRIVDGPSGHTVIQIDKNAQNSILLYGGANQKLTTEYIDEVLCHFSSDDILLLQNEVEGFQLTGETEPEAILAKLLALFPHARILLTLGKDGAVYTDGTQKVFQPIFPVKAVDTTAAGDTFTGYFLAGLIEGLPMEEVLRRCAKASSICVSREGAVPSIPYRAEVLDALES